MDNDYWRLLFLLHSFAEFRSSSAVATFMAGLGLFYGEGTFIRLAPLKVLGGLCIMVSFCEGICSIHDSNGNARI